MDLNRAIQDLRAEKERIERAIALLEGLEKTDPEKSPPPGQRARRGRKNMDLDERKQVGERMRAYWARKRGERNSQ